MKKLTAFILAVLMIASTFVLTVPTSAAANSGFVYTGSNTSDLIFGSDKEHVVNAGQLPDGTEVTLGGETSDSDWKYAYPLRLDSNYTKGTETVGIDLYVMWDANYIYFKEVRSSEPLPNDLDSGWAVNQGNYDATLYQILVPEIEMASNGKQVGVYALATPNISSTTAAGTVVANKTEFCQSRATYTETSCSGYTGNAITDYTSISRKLETGYEMETKIAWSCFSEDGVAADVTPEVNDLFGIIVYPSCNGKYGAHKINDKPSDASHGSWDGYAPMYLRGVDEKASEQTIDISWYNNTDTTFEISTAGQLRGLSYLTNQYSKIAGASDPYSITNGKTFVITSDIDLNPGWTVGDTVPPLYIWYDIAGFSGTLDGQGHTVSGAYGNTTWSVITQGYNSGSSYSDNVRHRGFISFVAANYTAAITNLEIVNSYVEGAYSVGGLVGYAWGSVVANNLYLDIDVDANISTHNYSYSGLTIGNLAGKATITNVVCAGNLKMTAASSSTSHCAGSLWGNGASNTANVVENFLALNTTVTTLWESGTSSGKANAIVHGGSKGTFTNVFHVTSSKITGKNGETALPTDWVTYDQAGTYEMPASVAEMVYGKVLAQVSEETYDNGTTFKVRIIDAVNSDEWASLGVNIDVYVDGELVETFPADADTTVFTSIKAAGNTVNATDADIDAKYIHMEVVSGLPTTGTVEIVVTPVKTLGMSTVTNARSYTFTFVNGEAVQ